MIMYYVVARLASMRVDSCTAAGAATVAATGNTVDQNNVEQWNYKETITTMFNESTGVCTKETKSQDCTKTKKNFCKTWGSVVTNTTSMDLM
ncbi:MAG: hypothetical protein IJ560_03380 [Alphaproteobacteria bacterium]|nr:hypothetical protein [Alphaproteobacteria bacterium]